LAAGAIAVVGNGIDFSLPTYGLKSLSAGFQPKKLHFVANVKHALVETYTQ